MRDNPVTVQAMRGDEAIRLHRLHAMFASALPMIADKGFVIGAFEPGGSWVFSAGCPW
jgi:hypothetical protein